MGLRLGIMAAVVACLVSVDLIRAAETPPAPVRIVCIGDSITQGRKGAEGDPKNAPTYSYRYPLWKKLLDAGVNVDFVGTQKTGFEGSPAYAPYRGKEFDNEHE
ncbi:MAG: hypothetical protein IMZ65_03155, partial [Planctomycetes bacterium]|nr:hypothetical protein [Planctomycetota bacterium]